MSISNQGIWIDCKQLLPLTYQLNDVLCNKDRILIGDRLIKANIDMIESFAMAYSRGDEHYTYDNQVAYYDIEIKGCKRNEIDKLQGSFEHYKALWEFIIEELNISRWNEDKKKKKITEFLTLLSKIEKGINKWKLSTSRQVTISRKRHDSV